MNRFPLRWGHLLDDDSETLAQLFDARFNPCGMRAEGDDTASASEIAVDGPIASLAPEGDEARALLAALERAGHAPAARDAWPSIVGPRLVRARVGARASRSCGARRPPEHRPSASLAPALHSGPLRAPSCALPAAAVCWPSFPRTTSLARAILSALRSFAQLPIRLVPSATSAPLEALCGEHLPTAELLGPTSSEHAWAGLVDACDVALACDPADGYERRALVAAAAGPATVHWRRGTGRGRCSATSWRSQTPTSPARWCERSRSRSSARTSATSARAVAETCGPAATAARLAELLSPLATGVGVR